MHLHPAVLSTGEHLMRRDGGSTKVLVVDDEPDIVEALAELLEDEGYSYLTAQTPHHALDLIRDDHEIGIVVTDIRMPGMDGIEMARQMKGAVGVDRDLYVIIVTGHAGMLEAIEALKLGAEDFLAKPISPDHLLHSVRRAEEMMRLRLHDRHFQKQMQYEVEAKTADLNEANRKLALASQIKDQFLSVMGHELRTPLNAINGFAELLKAKLHNADALVCEYIEHILQSGNRLTDTIENILEFSTAISGSRSVRIEPHSVEDLIGNVVGHLQAKAKERGVVLQQVPLPPVLQNLLVKVDSTMMIKALSCLTENAIKFSPKGEVVSLGTEYQPDAVTFFVKDNGCGMTRSEIERAKIPLNQVDSTLTRPVEGVGLGLSLALLLSELQGGSLTIDSTPGGGTTVRITLAQPQLSARS